MTATLTPGIGKDLRLAYLLAFDQFATDHVEISDTYPHVNTRYARELLAVLTSADLLILTKDNIGDNQAWKVNKPGSFEHHTRKDAEFVIDEWLAANYPDAVPAATPKPRTGTSSPKPKHDAVHPCLCGCGTPVPRKSNYRPGHDARHVGVVAREVASLPSRSTKKIAALIQSLPTDALRDKATAMAVRVSEKAKAK